MSSGTNYEIDGIVYAGNQKPMPTIIWAEYRGNHVIRAAYATGEIVDVDFSKHFTGPALEPLRNEEILKSFDYSLGFLQWEDGEIDVDPETMFEVGQLIEPAVSA